MIEKRDEYDKNADLSGSIKDGFAAIRERVADGGPGWQREAETVAAPKPSRKKEKRA